MPHLCRHTCNPETCAPLATTGSLSTHTHNVKRHPSCNKHCPAYDPPWAPSNVLRTLVVTSPKVGKDTAGILLVNHPWWIAIDAKTHSKWFQLIRTRTVGSELVVKPYQDSLLVWDQVHILPSCIHTSVEIKQAIPIFMLAGLASPWEDQFLDKKISVTFADPCEIEQMAIVHGSFDLVLLYYLLYMPMHPPQK